MTARSAYIHNETMKAAFVEYQEKLVNTQGKVESSDIQINARWLRKILCIKLSLMSFAPYP
ncbi:hypothetical protein Lste_1368 [Legionella steelei]|uniref:Uncharacterized protein n=1 Tax=Legionella steelei TaxID=947033 RepID=A0A0W0ZGJ3_9GAMM|nr:hypothetical protein Lste_1368 [Legionella steelei]